MDFDQYLSILRYHDQLMPAIFAHIVGIDSSKPLSMLHAEVDKHLPLLERFSIEWSSANVNNATLMNMSDGTDDMNTMLVLHTVWFIPDQDMALVSDNPVTFQAVGHELCVAEKLAEIAELPNSKLLAVMQDTALLNNQGVPGFHWIKIFLLGN